MAAVDLVLEHGTVLTLDRGSRVAEAVAVREGRIAAVGSSAALAREVGPATRRVDLAGRAVLPGFFDAHPHVDREGLKARGGVAIAGLRSVADIVEAAGRAAESVKPGEWVILMPMGSPPHDYVSHADQLAEGRFPDRHDLDAVAPDHPVYIRAVWGWWSHRPFPSVANSRALARCGITRDTPAPHGVEILRDARGEPTGVFLERNFVPVLEYTCSGHCRASPRPIVSRASGSVRGRTARPGRRRSSRATVSHRRCSAPMWRSTRGASCRCACRRRGACRAPPATTRRCWTFSITVPAWPAAAGWATTSSGSRGSTSAARRTRASPRWSRPSTRTSSGPASHHIRHWAQGGPTTLSNLALLCRRHHRAVHEEGFHVERLADGELRFRRPGGWVLPDVPPPPKLAGDPVAVIRAQNEAHGLTLHPNTGRPGWFGERLDLGYAIDVLHPRSNRLT